VAWHFGYAIHQKLQRPVGLIVSAVGGTPVQAWMPRAALDATSAAPAVWQRHNKSLEGYTPEKEQQFIAATAAWEKAPKATRGARPKVVYTPTYRNVPCRLYNGMLAGLGDYPIQGILWYQADGNIGFAAEYGELIQAMIKSWRRQWHADVPFYYVEMNDMHEPPSGPVDDSSWGAMSLLREEQAKALQLPKTGVVSSIDLGRVNNPTFNPHFPLKKPLGDRIAKQVLAEIYGQSLGEVYSPEFAACTVSGNKVRLRFKHAGGLRASGDGAVKGFITQQPDGTWAWAQARIEGEEVVVWSDQVPAPREVRYAWASNPVISLENSAGLPLRPFRVVVSETGAN
jgi:sialate O-acetylesterase